jgi:N-acetylglutamate synthase-like GNAT family acetyltransferase
MIKLEQIGIQKAKKEDMPYIKEKLQKYILDDTNLNWRQFFVGRSDGRVVVFGRIIDHREYFELASLGVDYYYRKKGFGIKMLTFLIKQAVKLNPHKPIYGVTHRPGFLKKTGFEEVNTYPEYLDYKKNYICKLDGSKIKIMRYRGNLLK